MDFVFPRSEIRSEILRSGEFNFHFYQKIGIIFRRALLTCGPAIRDIASYSLKLHHLKMKVGPLLTRFLWHDVQNFDTVTHVTSSHSTLLIRHIEDQHYPTGPKSEKLVVQNATRWLQLTNPTCLAEGLVNFFRNPHPVFGGSPELSLRTHLSVLQTMKRSHMEMQKKCSKFRSNDLLWPLADYYFVGQSLGAGKISSMSRISVN